jgi:membrane protease YdiL (CAAX protease family)
MPDLFLTTKYHVPRVRTERVLRERLIARLQQGLAHKLILISAPAGYGRSLPNIVLYPKPPTLPWTIRILIMMFSNAAFEELIFRGLLIAKMQPFLGKFAINLVTTIPFVLNHAGNSYMSDAFIFFILQLLLLSLAWCWLMQKTKGIWGSILFHAAMDIPVFVGIFSNL